MSAIEKSWVNVVALFGDNCATNKALARKGGGCFCWLCNSSLQFGGEVYNENSFGTIVKRAVFNAEASYAHCLHPSKSQNVSQGLSKH